MFTYLRIGIGLVILLLLGWALRLDALRADWRDKFLALETEANRIVAAVSLVTGNKKLERKDAAKQIEQFGEDYTALKKDNDERNAEVLAMGVETERLRTQNRNMVAEIADLKRRRQGLIQRLETEALTPRDESDCWAQIRAADEAINALYREGI